jgi:hypothetical protein
MLRTWIRVVPCCLLASSAFAQDLQCEKSASMPMFVKCKAASGETISFNCPTWNAEVRPSGQGLMSVWRPQSLSCDSLARYEDTVGINDTLASPVFRNRHWLFPSISFFLGFLIAYALMQTSSSSSKVPETLQ